MTASFESQQATIEREFATPFPTEITLSSPNDDTGETDTNIERGYDKVVGIDEGQPERPEVSYQERVRASLDQAKSTLKLDVGQRVTIELVKQFFQEDMIRNPDVAINISSVEAAIRSELKLQKTMDDQTASYLKKVLIPDVERVLTEARFTPALITTAGRRELAILTQDLDNYRLRAEVAHYMSTIVTGMLDEPEDEFRSHAEKSVKELRGEAETSYREQFNGYVDQLEGEVARLRRKIQESGALDSALAQKRDELVRLEAELDIKTAELEQRQQELEDADISLWDNEMVTHTDITDEQDDAMAPASSVKSAHRIVERD